MMSIEREPAMSMTVADTSMPTATEEEIEKARAGGGKGE